YSGNRGHYSGLSFHFVTYHVVQHLKSGCHSRSSSQARASQVWRSLIGWAASVQRLSSSSARRGSKLSATTSRSKATALRWCAGWEYWTPARRAPHLSTRFTSTQQENDSCEAGAALRSPRRSVVISSSAGPTCRLPFTNWYGSATISDSARRSRNCIPPR